MPPEVDLEDRLRAIAYATLELASETGPRGVTVRAVANRLGGSTTKVTRYLPSRPELLGNALRFVSEKWEIDLAEALNGKKGMDRIRALAKWSLQTVDHDDAIRRIWLETISGSPKAPDLESAIRESDDEYDSIRGIVNDADEPEWLADLLYLAFRGFYVSSIENPAAWPPERSFGAVNEVLNLLRSDQRLDQEG